MVIKKLIETNLSSWEFVKWMKQLIKILNIKIKISISTSITLQLLFFFRFGVDIF